MKKRSLIIGLVLGIMAAIGLPFLSAQATGGGEPTCEDEYITVHHEAETHQVYLYQKFVKGVVQQRDNGKDRWHTTGQTFGWTAWESFKESDEDVEVLESGPHSAVVKEWTEGNGHKHWRWLSTEYQYQQIGEETVVDKEAWDEQVANPDYPCEPEEPTDPVDPTDPVEPTDPVKPSDPPVVEEPPTVGEPSSPITNPADIPEGSSWSATTDDNGVTTYNVQPPIPVDAQQEGM